MCSESVPSGIWTVCIQPQESAAQTESRLWRECTDRLWDQGPVHTLPQCVYSSRWSLGQSTPLLHFSLAEKGSPSAGRGLGVSTKLAQGDGCRSCGLAIKEAKLLQ